MHTNACELVSVPRLLSSLLVFPCDAGVQTGWPLEVTLLPNWLVFNPSSKIQNYGAYFFLNYIVYQFMLLLNSIQIL